MKAVLVYHNAEVEAVVLTDNVLGVKEITEQTQNEYIEADNFFFELLEKKLKASKLKYTLVDGIEVFEG